MEGTHFGDKIVVTAAASKAVGVAVVVGVERIDFLKHINSPVVHAREDNLELVTERLVVGEVHLLAGLNYADKVRYS